MRKIVAAINMTIDGVFDHTVGIPDEEIHQHYMELLNRGDAVLYGRITYQLMEFWRTLLKQPSEEKSMNDFAKAIDRIPKIVFSRTLNEVDWESSTLAKRDLKDEVLALKQQPGNDIFIGSRSLIIQLMQMGLIDELQLCIYPEIIGQGRGLFENLNESCLFRLINTKSFKSGAIILYYQPKAGG
ncbi:dihydrofolate reductase family protein [Parapedobacter sp. 10938]|uniref:dihydrofolate reductase family protein n=1 Tax=Parapedobacter flavus TaxID=3110225 RepID=UPI002DB6F89B|nr:dihydrofolate reductase family protein [Parapedobacter sp. 10938]MEC3880233.1 dihydrofolate reductase family protein [Parapedobacter sp. 10938]